MGISTKAGTLGYKDLSKRQRIQFISNHLKFDVKTLHYIAEYKSTRNAHFNDARINMSNGKTPLDMKLLQSLIDDCESERAFRVK